MAFKMQHLFLVTVAMVCLTLMYYNTKPLQFILFEQPLLIVPAQLHNERDGEEGEGEVCGDSIPATALAPHLWLKYPNQKWRGFQLPILMAGADGRLGNVMGEYATIYAVGRAYNVTVLLHPQIKTELYQIFPHLTIPMIPGGFELSDWQPLNYHTSGSYGSIEAAAAGLLGPQRFLTTGYPFEIQLFNAYREDILRDLTFSQDIQKKVHNFWKKERKKRPESVLVGLHIRRTDYISFIKEKHSHMPGERYFKRAMAYYKNNFSNVLFVMASDEMKYVKNTFANYTDVTYAPGTPRELDMAILASCNHSIITFGSFGFWTGYLAGGLVLYPNLTLMSNYPFQRERYERSNLDFFIPIESD